MLAQQVKVERSAIEIDVASIWLVRDSVNLGTETPE
jgi:hypothetical protein